MTLSKNSNFLSVGGIVRQAASHWSADLDAKVTRPLRVVAVSGGLQSPSKSAGLAQHLLDVIADQVSCLPHLVDLGLLAPQLTGAVWRAQVPDAVEQALAVVEQAEMLVVATPVFRGSYTGLFKHFFDLIGQDALIDKPVLLAANGGSERHALVIDHQLRPLFSFFQARTLPLGVYATDKDFVDRRLRDEAVIERAGMAVQRALPLVELTRNTSPSAAGHMLAV
jgi:FMN reductase